MVQKARTYTVTVAYHGYGPHLYGPIQSFSIEDKLVLLYTDDGGITVIPLNEKVIDLQITPQE